MDTSFQSQPRGVTRNEEIEGKCVDSLDVGFKAFSDEGARQKWAETSGRQRANPIYYNWDPKRHLVDRELLHLSSISFSPSNTF